MNTPWEEKLWKFAGLIAGQIYELANDPLVVRRAEIYRLLSEEFKPPEAEPMAVDDVVQEIRSGTLAIVQNIGSEQGNLCLGLRQDFSVVAPAVKWVRIGPAAFRYNGLPIMRKPNS